MSVIRSTVLAAGKLIAQETSSLPLLAGDPYDTLLSVALRVFDADVPNVRIVHHTVASAAFRFTLAGAGALAELTGLDAWTRGKSELAAVWHPYDATIQGQSPLDPNTWRILEEPAAKTVLELLEITPSADVLRLELVNPHTVHASDVASTSVLAGDVEALEVLLASQILLDYAARSLQNTGNTGIPTDIVDRRTPADQARAVAKELFTRYQSMVGNRSDDEVKAAGATRELDIRPSYPSFGDFLWKPRSLR